MIQAEDTKLLLYPRCRYTSDADLGSKTLLTHDVQ